MVLDKKAAEQLADEKANIRLTLVSEDNKSAVIRVTSKDQETLLQGNKVGADFVITKATTVKGDGITTGGMASFEGTTMVNLVKDGKINSSALESKERTINGVTPTDQPVPPAPATVAPASSITTYLASFDTWAKEKGIDSNLASAYKTHIEGLKPGEKIEEFSKFAREKAAQFTGAASEATKNAYESAAKLYDENAPDSVKGAVGWVKQKTGDLVSAVTEGGPQNPVGNFLKDNAMGIGGLLLGGILAMAMGGGMIGILIAALVGMFLGGALGGSGMFGGKEEGDKTVLPAKPKEEPNKEAGKGKEKGAETPAVATAPGAAATTTAPAVTPPAVTTPAVDGAAAPAAGTSAPAAQNPQPNPALALTLPGATVIGAQALTGLVHSDAVQNVRALFNQGISTKPKEALEVIDANKVNRGTLDMVKERGLVQIRTISKNGNAVETPQEGDFRIKGIAVGDTFKITDVQMLGKDGAVPLEKGAPKWRSLPEGMVPVNDGKTTSNKYAVVPMIDGKINLSDTDTHKMISAVTKFEVAELGKERAAAEYAQAQKAAADLRTKTQALTLNPQISVDKNGEKQNLNYTFVNDKGAIENRVYIGKIVKLNENTSRPYFNFVIEGVEGKGPDNKPIALSTSQHVINNVPVKDGAIDASEVRNYIQMPGTRSGAAPTLVQVDPVIAQLNTLNQSLPAPTPQTPVQQTPGQQTGQSLVQGR